MNMTAPVLGPIGELAAHARNYGTAGFEVFPVNPDDKTPLVSQYQATTDTDQIDAWWAQWPHALIGCRVPEDQIILDIDPRHGGTATWLALKEAMGGVPHTRIHQSGRGDDGGHIWLTRPGIKMSIKPLNDWARERGVGHEVLLADGTGTGRWSCGIDLLHHTHRYTILPPSPHPVTRKPYQWLPDRGIDTQPAVCPQLLVDLLTDDQPVIAPVARPAKSSSADSIADWYTDTQRWVDLLTRHGWRLVGGDGDTDGSRWKHPTATSAFSATVRHGCLFVYSPNTPFDVTEPGGPAGYTLFRAYATLEHRGNMSEASRAARALKGGDTLPDPLEGVVGRPVAAAAVVEGEPDPRHFDDVIWDASPIYTHIRTAARSRLVAPDAVLAAVLTRIAAATPHIVDLPPIVGVPMGLTYYAAIVGAPETGKSAAAAVAADLLPVDRNKIHDRVPIGSGEGFVEILYGMRPDPENPKKQIKVQTHNAAIFHIDEGAVLTDLGARSGSTLLPTLRTAYTHGTLGNANASTERRRILEGHLYVYGVTLGIQPELAGPLLDDASGGTPQRFLWAMATDPGAPEEVPEWPGPLPWTPPSPKVLQHYESASRGGSRRSALVYDHSIWDEVQGDRRGVVRGETVKSNIDAHTNLVRLKTAGLLALLDGGMDVHGGHWELAGRIVATSVAVRQSIETTLSVVRHSSEATMAERQARITSHVTDVTEQRKLERAAAIVGRLVHRHADGGKCLDGCSAKCLTLAVGKRYRDLFSTDEIGALAASREWVQTDGEKWRPGPSKPAS